MAEPRAARDHEPSTRNPTEKWHHEQQPRRVGVVGAASAALWFDTMMPDGVQRLAFELSYRGQRMHADLTPASLHLLLHPCAAAPIHVDVNGTRSSLAAGGSHEFPIFDTRHKS